jgi:hypothetical protein
LKNEEENGQQITPADGFQPPLTSIVGLSRFEVGRLEFASMLLVNASKRVQAVKGAKEGFGCGVRVLEGTS